jgi:hypothetical protein
VRLGGPKVIGRIVMCVSHHHSLRRRTKLQSSYQWMARATYMTVTRPPASVRVWVAVSLLRMSRSSRQ